MAPTVLYRKYRPHRFADIVGQDPIVRTLRNAVAQGRLAHAYLFTGPRGTGKTSTGRIMAKAINAEQTDDGEAILTPEQAAEYDEGRALDLVEIDAASNRGIDDIRELRERANYVPTSGRYKVYLIDEVHQLTGPAADALLKTLEEPPPHVVFILATTAPESLKATVLSRCQRFDFRRVSVAALMPLLRRIADAESITIPDEALNLIAREATGSARDAVNLLDQVWAAYGDTISLDNAVAALGLSGDPRALDLARAAVARDLKAGLATLAAVQDDAAELGAFTKQVIEHLRHALLLQTGAGQTLPLSESEREALQPLLKADDPAAIVAALKAFSAADVRSDPYAALPLELALATLVYQPEPAPAPARSRASKDAAPRRGERRGQGSGRRPRPPERRPAAASPPAARPAEQKAAAGPADQKAPAKPSLRPRERTPEEQKLQDIVAALDAANEKKLAAYIRSNSCRIDGVSDGVLTLAFFPNYVTIHMKGVMEGAQAVAAAATKVYGTPLTLKCVQADEPKRRTNALVEQAERLGARRVGPRES